ncbi:MAG: (2Fe-2S)-binding protein [Elusimicrobia bacterium]|nr:(2Fe-2S)-binding protein [Elusimicrobiota bacterium]
MTDNKNPYLCHCLKVTEAEVREAIARHRPGRLKELIRCSGAGQGCIACHSGLRQILEEGPGGSPILPPLPPAPSGSSPAPHPL